MRKQGGEGVDRVGQRGEAPFGRDRIPAQELALRTVEGDREGQVGAPSPRVVPEQCAASPEMAQGLLVGGRLPRSPRGDAVELADLVAERGEFRQGTPRGRRNAAELADQELGQGSGGTLAANLLEVSGPRRTGWRERERSDFVERGGRTGRRRADCRGLFLEDGREDPRGEGGHSEDHRRRGEPCRRARAARGKSRRGATGRVDLFCEICG